MSADTSAEYKYSKYKTKYNTLKHNLQRGGEGETGRHEEIMKRFFEHLTMIKMLHFQSEKYGAHKALDTYYGTFNLNMDKFMEVLQGERGRIEVNGTMFSTETELANDSDIAGKLDVFKQQVLVGMFEGNNYGTNSALVTIRDDMSADLDQLKYLLSFQ